jgi:pimeloyl-ACP methyl ester carboxylesterase
MSSVKHDLLWHKYLNRPYRLQIGTDAGSGEPLILLHGIGAQSEIWQPLVRQIDTKKWRIVAPDLLGFGRSPKPDWNSYDVHQHARAVVSSLHRSGVGRNATIVAHSMGCLIAIHIAASWPKLVKRLVLYEPPLFVDLPDFRRHSKQRQRRFTFYRWLAARPDFVLSYARHFSRLTRYDAFMGRESWTAFERSLHNTIIRQATYDELTRLEIPADIVHGRLDFIVSRAEMKKIFKDHPHVRLHIVNQLHGVTPRAAKYLARLLDTRYT